MTSEAKPLNVLFLCTGNSARSILAEAIMNRLGKGNFVAYSAGSHPKGEVHPQALKLVTRLGYDVKGYRSKPWDEFAAPGAPHLNFVITVCDNAAGEVCPVWPGQPVTSHWGLPDPAAVEGSEAQIALAFADTYRMLNNRIGIFVSLPMEKLSRLALQEKVDTIGKSTEVEAAADDAKVQALHATDPKSLPLLDKFVEWLEAAKLPIHDLADDQPRYFVLKTASDEPLAFGGLIGFGPDQFVRSLVVDPGGRADGAGSRFLKSLEGIAAETGAERLWALTETAVEWFTAAGWRVVERDQAPESIRRLEQFSRTCSPSATLLALNLA